MQNSDPLVTVICSCYNHSDYIEIALDSVLNQTYKNIQLITKDTRGCADTLVQQAFVVPLPTAAFVVNNANQCENHNLFIYEANNTNASNAGSVSSSWDFGLFSRFH